MGMPRSPANEMTYDIHHCCRSEHHKQVLKLQEHEGHSRLQISVNRVTCKAFLKLLVKPPAVPC